MPAESVDIDLYGSSGDVRRGHGHQRQRGSSLGRHRPMWTTRPTGGSSGGCGDYIRDRHVVYMLDARALCGCLEWIDWRSELGAQTNVCGPERVGRDIDRRPLELARHFGQVRARVRWQATSGDGGDVAVVEVDGLVESSAECGGEAGDNLLAGDLALLDSGDPPFGNTHAVGDLLLRQAAGLPDFGKAVPEGFGEQFLFAGIDSFFSADPGNVLGADVGPAYLAGHGRSPSCDRSFT